MTVVFHGWQRPLPYVPPMAPNFGWYEGYFTFEMPMNINGRTNFVIDCSGHCDAFLPDEKLNRLLSNDLTNSIDLNVKTDQLEIRFDFVDVSLADDIMSVSSIYSLIGLPEDHKTEILETFNKYMNDVSCLICRIFDDEEVHLPEGDVCIDDVKHFAGYAEIDYKYYPDEDETNEEVKWYSIHPGEPYYTKETYEVFRKYHLTEKEEGGAP